MEVRNCFRCGGSGRVTVVTDYDLYETHEIPCSRCHGRGYVVVNRYDIATKKESQNEEKKNYTDEAIKKVENELRSSETEMHKLQKTNQS